jgi:hypothetical protein
MYLKFSWHFHTWQYDLDLLNFFTEPKYSYVQTDLPLPDFVIRELHTIL